MSDASGSDMAPSEHQNDDALPESLGEYTEDFQRELRRGDRDRSADKLRQLLCRVAAEGDAPGDGAVLDFVQLAELIRKDSRLNPPHKQLLSKQARDKAALSHPAAGELLVYLADAMAAYAGSFDDAMPAGKRMAMLAKAFRATGTRGESRLSRELRQSAEATLHRTFIQQFRGNTEILERQSYRLREWERAHDKALDAAYLVLNPGKTAPAGTTHHGAVKKRLRTSYQLLLNTYPMPS